MLFGSGRAAYYREVELEVRWVTGGLWAVNELVLLVCREVRLEEAVVLLPLPPAILPNCSGVSSFLGSLICFFLVV